MEFEINPAQQYASTMDSVNLVNALKAQATLTLDEVKRLKSNRDHIEAMLGKDFWTTEDLQPVIDALDGTDYVSPTPTLADFDRALTAHLDNTAKQRRYDNRITCMVRAGFPGPFQVEALAFATWCDNCNLAAYTLLAEVQAGTQPMPASPAEFIGMLPEMVWQA